jgi:hypothetical protein
MPERAEFDPAAGRYKILGGPRKRSAAELRTLSRSLGVAHPTEGIDIRPALRDVAAEWYDRRIAARTRTTQRIRGRSNPKLVTETEHYELTAGVAIGGLALVLGWEASQSISHGLAGMDPKSWMTDIADWIEGKPAAGNIADNSLGGWISANVMAILSPPTPPPPAPSAPPPPPAPSPAPSPSPPPPSGPPPVQFDALGIPYCGNGYVPQYRNGAWVCVPWFPLA